MWSKTQSKVYPGVSKENVWRVWADVDNWTAWHGDLDYVKMNGEFAVGSHFLLKPKAYKEVKIGIVELSPGKMFTDCTTFFGAKMYDTHELEETPDGLRLSSTLTVTGPLAFLWRRLVAEGVAKAVPEENDALVEVARASKTGAPREAPPREISA